MCVFCLFPSWRLRYPQSPRRKGRHRGRLQVKGELQEETHGGSRRSETVNLSTCSLILCLPERKRRCEEEREAGSLRLHPSKEGPAQPQVLQPPPPTCNLLSVSEPEVIHTRASHTNELYFFPTRSQEACQTAGPVQGHGEGSPEGGAVWTENAEEKGESLKKKNQHILV